MLQFTGESSMAMEDEDPQSEQIKHSTIKENLMHRKDYAYSLKML